MSDDENIKQSKPVYLKFKFYIILKMKIHLLIFNIALIILKCIKHITFETSLIFETNLIIHM